MEKVRAESLYCGIKVENFVTRRGEDVLFKEKKILFNYKSKYSGFVKKSFVRKVWRESRNCAC